LLDAFILFYFYFISSSSSSSSSSSDGLFQEVESFLSAMCSVSVGWFVRGITPSVGKLEVQKCVVVDFAT
jgi:hypothetical protein